MFFKASDILSMSFNDLMGQRFNRLTAIGMIGRSKNGYIIWECFCDCGNMTNVTSDKLRNKHTQSCGCLRRDRAREKNTTHGKYYHRIYSIWRGILSRCNNPNHDAFSNYGGRGIQVCERWLKFENFFADMGDPPEGLTIDRINVNGNYEPNNCRWATWSKQNLNKRK